MGEDLLVFLCSYHWKVNIFGLNATCERRDYSEDWLLTFAVIGLIWDSYESVLNSCKTVEVTVRNSHHCTPSQNTQQRCVGCRIFQVSGVFSLPGPKVGVQHQHSHQKGPAEDVLHMPAQEIQPVSGAADRVLHCSHQVCSLHIHHSLIWIGHQTRQEQTTTTDSQVCKKDYQCWPVHLQSQETGKENHCRYPHTLCVTWSNFSPLVGVTVHQNICHTYGQLTQALCNNWNAIIPNALYKYTYFSLKYKMYNILYSITRFIYSNFSEYLHTQKETRYCFSLDPDSASSVKFCCQSVRDKPYSL